MLTPPIPAMSRRGFLSTGLAASTLTLAPDLLHAASTSRSLASIEAITFHQSGLIVAADGLWRRTDDGGWRHLADMGSTQTICSHTSKPDTLFTALREGGVRRSIDGGLTWTDVSTDLPNVPATAMTIAAQDSEMLYVALAGDGLWRSKNAGDTWEFVMDRPYLGGTEHDVLSLVSVGNATGMGGIWLYAGTAAGLTRVPDCFCRWQDVTAGDAMDALAAGKTPAAVKPLPAGEPVQTLALAPQTPDRIYAGLPSGLWASTDAGVNWAKVSAEPTQALAVNPGDPLHLVSATLNDLRESHDAGATWTQLNPIKEV